MEPLFLSGEFDLTLDDKSRLMVPAPFRKRINPLTHGEGFYLVVSPRRTLNMFPQLYYEWLTMQRPVDDVPDEASVEYDRLSFAVGGGVVETDKAGRVVLSDKVRRRVALGREVTVIGSRDHLEIWNRDAWEQYSEDLLKRSGEVSNAVRTSRRSPQWGGPSAMSHGGAGQFGGMAHGGASVQGGSGPQGSGPGRGERGPGSHGGGGHGGSGHGAEGGGVPG